MFWGRIQSSTQITDPYSSYRHKGSCRTIAIRSGPHIYNSFILTSSTRREATIMFFRLPWLIFDHGGNHHSQILWAREFWLATSLQEQSRIQPHIQGTLGRYASSKFSPPRCIVMSPGTPLCSFKRARQDDMGSTLQSSRWEFRGRENNSSTREVFLLAEPSKGCREAHQILHCLCHCQTDHQEARPIYSTTYP